MEQKEEQSVEQLEEQSVEQSVESWILEFNNYVTGVTKQKDISLKKRQE